MILVLQLFSRRFAVKPGIRMRGCRKKSGRRQHSVLGRCAPDNILAQRPTIREFGKRRHRRGDDIVVSNDHGSGRANDDIRRVVVVKFGNAAVFPQRFRDPDDVVRKVNKLTIEAFDSYMFSASLFSDRERQPTVHARLVEFPQTRKYIDPQLFIGVEQIDHHPVFADLSLFHPPEIQRFHRDALA